MHPRDLRIEDFTYALPVERIAQFPLSDRAASKLLIYRGGSITDDRFANIGSHLPEGSLIITNDTRVVKARINFTRSTGAVIECMVLEPEDPHPMEHALAERGRSRWWCMIGNAKRWKGEALQRTDAGATLAAEGVDSMDGEHLLEFTWNDERTFAEILAQHGTVPLPPYMKRDAMEQDAERYNTVFAEHDGSVAAPTASLHFDRELLSKLVMRGVQRANVTLHVGAGTFLPVKSERMDGHTMHREQVRVPRATVEALLAAHDRSAIVPIGTTALRTIESLCWFGDDLLSGCPSNELEVGQWRPYEKPPMGTIEALTALLNWMGDRAVDHVSGHTALLIAPGYRFRLATGLVTNFHQPGSTLLLLVAAFLGEDRRTVYDYALANDYRFLSYGDGSLLWLTS